VISPLERSATAALGLRMRITSKCCIHTWYYLLSTSRRALLKLDSSCQCSGTLASLPALAPLPTPPRDGELKHAAEPICIRISILDCKRIVCPVRAVGLDKKSDYCYHFHLNPFILNFATATAWGGCAAPPCMQAVRLEPALVRRFTTQDFTSKKLMRLGIAV